MLLSKKLCTCSRGCRYSAKRWFLLSRSSQYSQSSADVSAQEKLKLLAKEKQLMKQKKKEIKRQERIESQQKKLLQEKVGKHTQPSLISFSSPTLPDAYDPSFVESKWYNYWMELGLFDVDSPIYKNLQQNKEQLGNKFTMVLPPPNVTGSLHLGHALGCSIQDAICRWHRMKGNHVTWVPGCDHAGIATQVVVEKKLMKEANVTRHDVGREKFLEEVWKWKGQNGGRILDQMKRLGCSLDWSKNCFTLDPKLSRAVNEAFIRLFEEGLISRRRRIVNWSCALKSAISDIEVETLTLKGPTKMKVPGYKDDVLFGIINKFAYPLCDSDEKIFVATTRLETMLGDVGLAVHPDDSRYSHLIGKSVLHPFTNQPLPIVSDRDVIPDFGTGIVKLTPGHDSTDFNIASRHDLKVVNILDDSGSLVNVPREFMNLPRFHAREMVKEKLDSMGLYGGSADHPMALPVCGRSGDVVEFVVRDQWFLDCEEMIERAREAVKTGRLTFQPAHYKKQWNDWLNNTKDWCISRQLWWGHRIPAYTILNQRKAISNNSNEEDECHWIASHDEKEAKMKASKVLDIPVDDVVLRQDEDVLDTWFSSALFPFSVFGWPDKTPDLTRFYPTDLLETASDIMFFWVARMVMMGEKLTGQLPFKKVLFHSIVQDAHGRKMSKSLGNVVDPMHVVEGVTLEDLQANLEASNLSKEEIVKAKPILKRDFPLGIPECGADALRFAMCSYSYLGHSVNVDINHMKFCRTFCNKIWQSFKFINSKLQHNNFQPVDISNVPPTLLSPLDRWILSRLHSTVLATDRAFQSHELFEATRSLQNFWWAEFCNAYMECIKSQLAEEAGSDRSDAIKAILLVSVETFLKLLHPFMPFLTEHLYQELKRTLAGVAGVDGVDAALEFHKSISVAPFPDCLRLARHHDVNLEGDMTKVMNIVSKILSDKILLKIEKSVKLSVFVAPGVNVSVTRHLPTLMTLTRSNVEVVDNDVDSPPPSGSIHVGDVDGCRIYFKLKGVVNIDERLDGLCERRDKQERERQSLERSPAMSDPSHDQHLVVMEKMAGIKTTMKRIEEMIEALKRI